MSVKYRKVKNNRKGSATRGKIYGKAVVDGVIRTKEIAEKIGKRCSLTDWKPKSPMPSPTASA